MALKRPNIRSTERQRIRRYLQRKYTVSPTFDVLKVSDNAITVAVHTDNWQDTLEAEGWKVVYHAAFSDIYEIAR